MPGCVEQNARVRRPAVDLLLLAVAVAAVSTSGPLITVTAAPALAIAFWRNAFGSLAVVPVAAWRRRDEIRGMARQQWLLALLAGLLLAGHFATWVPSLRFTTVASSTAMASTQPVWTALIARALGERLSGRVWAGTGVAILGALLLSGTDLRASGEALTGDLLALVGAILAAAYTVAGSRVRQGVSTTTYTAICYPMAAAALLVTCLVSGSSLGGYSADTWVKIGALTVGAQLLGHSVFNTVVKRVGPTVVSLSILFEVPGATLVAALTVHQHVPLQVLPALLLLLAGLALVVSSRTPPEAVPVE